MSSGYTPATEGERNALQMMSIDLITGVLEQADNPVKLGEYISHEMRELSGARIVVLLQNFQEIETDGLQVLTVFPERRQAIVESDNFKVLAQKLCGLTSPSIFAREGDDDEVSEILAELSIGLSMAVPLSIGEVRVGLLLLLGLPTEHLVHLLIESLDLVSTIIALVMHNALLFENQEKIIALRTKELRESEERSRSLFENTPVAIWVADLSRLKGVLNKSSEFEMEDLEGFFRANPEIVEELGSFVKLKDVNHASVDLFRTADKQELQRVWLQSLTPRSLVTFTRSLQALIEGKTFFQAETEFRTLDGSIREISMSWSVPPGFEESYSRVLISFVDITDRKRAEEERLKIETQMQHAQKLESLGVLAGGIAHDFNNLLGVILGHADLALLDQSPASPIRDNLREIEKASIRAADLCKQMLAYSGKGTFLIESLSLSEVVREMAHMLEISIHKKIALQYNFAKGLPPIEADATQIRQVIMNLITNASEAIEDNSGIISVNTGSMECDSEYLSESYINEELPGGRYVYLEVSDSGCGMDKEVMDKLFDPFYTTKFTGRGLGLAAVLGIVRGHKGVIKLYSEEGKGTTFKVLFPAMDADNKTGTTEDQAAKESWRGAGTVLLVDDEEAIRDVGKRMLEKLGFKVLTASDGHEGLDVFAKHADEIDLVLLDLTMPRMDGVETFHEMRWIKKDIRAIIASGYSEQEVSQRFGGKGLTGFIQKPYQTEALAAKMKEVLG